MPKTYTQADLLKELQEMAARCGRKKTASYLGVTTQMVSDLLLGKRDISERIAASLGYERNIVFRKIAA